MSILHILCSLRVKNPGFPGNLHCFASTGCCSLPSPWHLRYSTASRAGTEQNSLVLLLPQPWPSAGLHSPAPKHQGSAACPCLLGKSPIICTDLSHSFRLSSHTAPAWVKLHPKRQQLQTSSDTAGSPFTWAHIQELEGGNLREWQTDTGWSLCFQGIAVMCLSRWQQWEEKPIRRIWI